MFGWRQRRERRLRERGLPAAATITEVRPAGDGRWKLRVRVVPHGEPSFVASTEAALPSGAVPTVGSRIDVLYEPGGGSHVVLTGAPSTAAVPAVEVTASSPAADEPPGALEVLGDVLRHFEDAARVSGAQPPATRPAGGDAAPPVGAAAAPEMSVAQLAALAALDPDGAGDEILRRIETGETTPILLVGEARGLDPAGRAGALAALRALHQRGAIDDARLALVQMLLG